MKHAQLVLSSWAYDYSPQVHPVLPSHNPRALYCTHLGPTIYPAGIGRTKCSVTVYTGPGYCKRTKAVYLTGCISHCNTHIKRSIRIAASMIFSWGVQPVMPKSFPPKIGPAGPILEENFTKSGPAGSILLLKSVRPDQFWQPIMVPL